MIQPTPSLWQRITRFGYDAIKSNGRRRATATRVKHEDAILPARDRQKLQATTQEVQRNFATAAWAIRQHLNYVSAFTFQARTGNDELDDQIESFMTNWGSKYNCDVRRQHPFRRMIRLAEAMRVVNGDHFFVKLGGEGFSRGRLQAIESDCIADPPNAKPDDLWVSGVHVSPAGGAKEYAIHRRTLDGKAEYQRNVPASNMFVHGFYDRFDQVRGISPIASALNSFQDVYEGIDYALAKIKVSQLFALAFYREASDPFDGTTATLDADGDGTEDSGYEVDFGAGPQMLDLSPGDRAEFLESKTPATETTQFLKLVIHVALKSLDIPYSFFDESFTNFYGSRGGLIQYLKGCRHKQQDLQELLDEITSWRLGMAVADGDIILPPGMDFQMVDWEWVPDGVPWWDPAKEVAGHGMAIAAGLDSPQRVCRTSGTDFYENIDAIAHANAYARERGVTLIMPGAATAQTAAQDRADTQEAQSGGTDET